MTSYTIKEMATTLSFTRESIEDAIRQVEWLAYEVDPEWSKFCSFGPEDIGSVWEKIGVIRRKPQYDTVLVSRKMAQKMNNIMEQQILYGATHAAEIQGIRVIASPACGDNVAYLMRGDIARGWRWNT